MSECHRQELQKCMEDFDSMFSFQNPRCLIPETNRTHQLLTLTDESMAAIAPIVYARTTNADGCSTFQYVISKTKVASIKQLSLPKLKVEVVIWSRDLNLEQCYTWVDLIQAETKDLHCLQVDQNSGEFQPL